LGGSLGADTLCSETIIGQLVKPAGMDRYFFLGGAADGRVTEVLGLDTVRRLPDGEYVHTEAQVALAKQAQADYQQALSEGSRLTIVRGQAGLSAAKPVRKYVDAGRSFAARAAYDAKHLYVAYEVTSLTDLVNAINDPKLIFKGGNLIDLQFAADPAANPNRKTPAPGDVRLLVTQQAEKTGGRHLPAPSQRVHRANRIVLTSPTGKESF